MLCLEKSSHEVVAEADPTNREIAKELQVCLDRSAAGGEALEYRNHAFQDERSLHSERMTTWMFPKIGVPQNAWFIMEKPLKWMIWGYPYFWKHPHGFTIITVVTSL